MSGTEVHVGRIVSLEQGRDGWRLALDDGGSLQADAAAPSFPFWSRLVQVSRRYGWPVYARCRPAGQVRVLLPASVYTVAQLRPDPNGEGLRVAFYESHALHLLRGSRPDHDQLKERLQEARRTGRRLVVTESPRQPEIVDVRFDEPPAARA